MEREKLKNLVLNDSYIDIAIKRYLSFRTSKEYDEKYKFNILQELKQNIENMDTSEGQIGDYLTLIKTKNPTKVTFAHWSAVDNLSEFYEEAPTLCAGEIQKLYSGTSSIGDRVDQFHLTAKEYEKNMGAPLLAYLLAAYDYEKYPLYKEEILQKVKKNFQIEEKLGSPGKNYQLFYDICSIILEYAIDQGLEWTMLDVQDLLYCVNKYPTLITEVAVEYIQGYAKQLYDFSQNDEKFLTFIKNELPRKQLEERHSYYKNRDKVNKIRYLLLEHILQDGDPDIEELERLKIEINNEYETNIIHSWNNFRILFQIYFPFIKSRINDQLRKIHTTIREIEEFQGMSFSDGTLNDFSWNQNFGTTECWLAVYPDNKLNHKDAAQLFLSIKESTISYGLVYGANHENVGIRVLDSVEGAENFAFQKMKDKFLDVMDAFLNGNSHQNKEDIQYFWLTANPSIWSVNEIKDGGEVYYTGINENGNKRRIYDAFIKAQPGDKVLFYESTPIKSVVAEGVVTQGLHVEIEDEEEVQAVSFRYAKDIKPIPWEQIVNKESLKNSSPVANRAQGSLFEMTKEEFEDILLMENKAESTPLTVDIPVIDFNKTISIEGLYFEELELLKKQIHTALASGKNILLTGPPGTGKSKLAKEICRSFAADYTLVTATSDWSTYETIGGYKPNSDGTLTFQPGLFLNSFKEPVINQPLNKWVIVDEMNRADIDKAFGALFSALTGDPVTLNFQTDEGKQIVIRPQREVENVLPSDQEYIIPNDWRLIGTLNTYDKASLYEMSYAFMRRFAFIPVPVPKDINQELIEYYLPLWDIHDYKHTYILADIWKEINQYRQIGPAIIEDIAKFTLNGADFTSAVILYVLPHLEGLFEQEIKSFIERMELIPEIDIIRMKDFAYDFFRIKE